MDGLYQHTSATTRRSTTQSALNSNVGQSGQWCHFGRASRYSVPYERERGRIAGTIADANLGEHRAADGESDLHGARISTAFPTPSPEPSPQRRGVTNVDLVRHRYFSPAERHRLGRKVGESWPVIVPAAAAWWPSRAAPIQPPLRAAARSSWETTDDRTRDGDGVVAAGRRPTSAARQQHKSAWKAKARRHSRDGGGVAIACGVTPALCGDGTVSVGIRHFGQTNVPATATGVVLSQTALSQCCAAARSRVGATPMARRTCRRRWPSRRRYHAARRSDSTVIAWGSVLARRTYPRRRRGGGLAATHTARAEATARSWGQKVLQTRSLRRRRRGDRRERRLPSSRCEARARRSRGWMSRTTRLPER
jgi:hypothetical protein